MNPVNSSDDVLGFIRKIKDQKKEYITNFFPDFSKIQLWIKLGIFKYEDFGDTTFLFRKNRGFNNLFFISNGIAALSDKMEHLIKNYTDELFIADIVGKRLSVYEQASTLENKGFFHYTSLLRMSRLITDAPQLRNSSLHISNGTKDQAESINDLLQRYFDPYAEQLPLIEEIQIWIDNNNVLIYSDDQKFIQGFVIFEITGQTSYLRYWFVHPAHREKKIGSSLLQKFFFESRNTRKQIFWVIESNENAIKRYVHYGYEPEELYDIVLINKNMHYEGKDS